MKTEDRMKRKIEQQQEQRATLAATLRTNEPRTRKLKCRQHANGEQADGRLALNRKSALKLVTQSHMEYGWRATLAETLGTDTKTLQTFNTDAAYYMREYSMFKKNREQRWQRRLEQAKLHAGSRAKV